MAATDGTPVKELGLPSGVDPRHMLLMLLQIVEHAQAQARHYAISLPRHQLDLLLQDVASVIDAPLEPEHRRDDLLDSLIESGAGVELVASYAAGMDLSDASIPLTKENRAVPDASSFEEALPLGFQLLHSRSGRSTALLPPGQARS